MGRPLLLALLLVGLTSPLFAHGNEPPELTYRFELVRQPALAVRVHIELPGAADGKTTLDVEREWGGVTTGGDDMTDVTATDESGHALTVTRPAPDRVVVTHPPGARLRVTYAFAATDHQANSDPAESRRPIVNAHLFRIVGYLGLLRPDHIARDAPCTIHLGWDGFDAAGWRAVSSWGAGTGDRTVTASLADLGNALYVAGDLRLITRDIHGHPLTITVSGNDWTFTPEAFADVCARIVETERAFFDDFAHDFYWVSLVPTGPPHPTGTSLGGSGLTNCFSLGVGLNTVLAPDDGSESGLVRLLAHEMFHQWNGQTIHMGDPEQLLYWFSEGFTDFYSRRLRYRGGFIDAAQYAASVTQAIERYATSPVRDAPDARILSDFWKDRDVKNLPYDRGDIAAMLLDTAIRKRSNGAKSLDDVMRAMLVKARADSVATMENLFATFSDYADPETVATVRDMIENGGVPDLTGIFSPCLKLEPFQAYAYDAGFDLNESVRKKTVIGLRPGSAAEKAGLRNGMTLEKWSFWAGDVDKPMTFGVVVDGKTQKVSYYPRGDVVRSYRASVADAGSCSSL